MRTIPPDNDARRNARWATLQLRRSGFSPDGEHDREFLDDLASREATEEARRVQRLWDQEIILELVDSGFSRSVLTTNNKNVVQYELDGARYVVRDAATSTGGPTADFYPAGSDAFTLKIRLGGS